MHFLKTIRYIGFLLLSIGSFNSCVSLLNQEPLFAFSGKIFFVVGAGFLLIFLVNLAIEAWRIRHDLRIQNKYKPQFSTSLNIDSNQANNTAEPEQNRAMRRRSKSKNRRSRARKPQSRGRK
jgi:hypothetical protein